MKGTARTLVIMAKAPRPGCVKTRLNGVLPLQAIVELYQCLLNDSIALGQRLERVQVAIMCPATDVEDFAGVVDKTVQITPQTGEGLSAALACVFAQFATHGQHVIAFNSDSPHLPAAVLEAAFEALETCDLIVGPTHDGGYYLVGAKASRADLFTNEGMGTANALDALLARARVLGLSVHLTDPFYDIDVATDLSRLADELQRAPEKAPKTAKWLSKWAHVVRRSPISYEDDSSLPPGVHSAT